MKTKLQLLVLTPILFLASCADKVSPEKIAEMDPVGFWYGFWHGLILIIAWIISLFDKDVAVYATYNNGGWYDFGFVLAIWLGIQGAKVKVSSKK